MGEGRPGERKEGSGDGTRDTLRFYICIKRNLLQEIKREMMEMYINRGVGVMRDFKVKLKNLKTSDTLC